MPSLFSFFGGDGGDDGDGILIGEFALLIDVYALLPYILIYYLGTKVHKNGRSAKENTPKNARRSQSITDYFVTFVGRNS